MIAERQTEARRFTGKRGAFLAWMPWLIGPVAWAAHQNGTYWLSTWMCEADRLSIFHAATLAGLALTVVGGLMAWRLLHYRDPAVPPREEEPTLSRIRFQALAGLFINAISFAGIALEGIPNFVLDPCIGIP